MKFNIFIYIVVVLLAGCNRSSNHSKGYDISIFRLHCYNTDSLFLVKIEPGNYVYIDSTMSGPKYNEGNVLIYKNEDSIRPLHIYVKFNNIDTLIVIPKDCKSDSIAFEEINGKIKVHSKKTDFAMLYLD